MHLLERADGDDWIGHTFGGYFDVCDLSGEKLNDIKSIQVTEANNIQHNTLIINGFEYRITALEKKVDKLDK